MKKFIPLAVFASLAVTISGCSASPTPEPTNVVTPTPTESKVWSPKYAEIVNLNGNEQTIRVGEFLELVTMRTDAPTAWIPKSSDDSVASVAASSPNKFGTPTVEGVKAGTATITLTNERTNEIVTFGVKVTGE